MEIRLSHGAGRGLALSIEGVVSNSKFRTAVRRRRQGTANWAHIPDTLMRYVQKSDDPPRPHGVLPGPGRDRTRPTVEFIATTNRPWPDIHLKAGESFLQTIPWGPDVDDHNKQVHRSRHRAIASTAGLLLSGILSDTMVMKLSRPTPAGYPGSPTPRRHRRGRPRPSTGPELIQKGMDLDALPKDEPSPGHEALQPLWASIMVSR